MFCPKCGTENADGSAFCNHCGANISRLSGADFTESTSAGQVQSGDAAAPDTKLPLAFRMWFIILLLFSSVGTIFGIILFIIRLVKYPGHRKPALIGMGASLAVCLASAVVISCLYEEPASQKIQEQETQEVQQKTESVPHEESESTSKTELVTETDTETGMEMDTKADTDTDIEADAEADTETDAEANTETDTRNYTHEEILATLLHEEILKEYGIEPNCASERKKVISKIEKALTKNPVYAKEEDGGFLEGEYLAITRNTSSFLYYGDVKNNRPDGFGIVTGGQVTLDDLSTLPNLWYAGNFKNGKFDGYGVTFFYSGSHTRYDTILKTLNDANTADAELIAAYYTCYVVYDGYAKGYKKDGSGNEFSLVTSVDGNGIALSSKVAEWKNGEYSGKLKGYYNDMLGFDGTMKNGKRNGIGVQYYDNGQAMYSGEWKNDEYNGKGTLYERDGTVIYSGEWENGDYKS